MAPTRRAEGVRTGGLVLPEQRAWGQRSSAASDPGDF